MNKKRNWLTYFGIVVFACFAVLPLFTNNYVLSSALSILFLIALTAAWNLFSGTTGYLSFAHVAFYGTAAYSTALLSKAGMPIGVALIVSALIVTVIYTPIVWVLLRLSGSFFVVGTLGLSSIVMVIATGWTSLTGGANGLSIAPVDTLKLTYYALLILAILFTLVTWYIYKSRFGLRLFAIKDDEIGVQALGFNPTKEKMMIFIVSIFMTALVGGFYTIYYRFLEPQALFGMHMVIDLILIGILGGMGTVMGPIVGALIIGILSEVAWSYSPDLHSLMVGIAIVLIALFLPRGLIKRHNRKREKHSKTVQVAPK
jgi:branched-chain amino acid transport system permease protein